MDIKEFFGTDWESMMSAAALTEAARLNELCPLDRAKEGCVKWQEEGAFKGELKWNLWAKAYKDDFLVDIGEGEEDYFGNGKRQIHYLDEGYEERVIKFTKYQNRDVNGRFIFSHDNFVSFLFPCQVCLEEVTLTKGGDFQQAIFMGKTNISHVVFDKMANFCNTTFARTTNFQGTVFNKKANFTVSKFMKAVFFNDSIFDDVADFDGAIFSRGVIYIAAVFNNEVSFKKAVVTKQAVFTQTIFNRVVSFYNSIFENGISFKGATFHKAVDFRRTTINDFISLRSATINSVINCKKTIFNGDADFREAEFFSGPMFCDASFIKEVTFHKATFMKGPNFSGVTFREDVDFHQTKFINGANFQSVKFMKKVSFREATFKKGVNFLGSFFKDEVVFFRSKFIEGVTFSEGVFMGKVSFYGAQLNNNSIFKKTLFIGPCDFNSIIADDVMNFTKACFLNSSDFGHAVIKGNIQFHWVGFGSAEYYQNRGRLNEETIWQLEEYESLMTSESFAYKNTVPNFIGLQVPVTPDLGFVKIKYHPDMKDRQASAKFRKLKEMAAQTSNHSKELEYFREELLHKPHSGETSSNTKFLIWMYEAFSRCGTSGVRPAIWLLGSMVFFPFLYYWLNSGQVWVTDDSLAGLMYAKFSLHQSVPFLGLGGGEYEAVVNHLYGGYEGIPNWIGFWSGVQKTISLTLAFLVGLGIRNYYRM